MNASAAPGTRPRARATARPAATGAATGAVRALRPSALRAAARRPTRGALVKDVLLYAALALSAAIGMMSPPRPGRRPGGCRAPGSPSWPPPANCAAPPPPSSS